MIEIQIGYSAPRKWFVPISWLIKLVEGTKHSHVFIRMRHSSGVEFIYEASGTSVKFKNAEIFDADNETLCTYRIPITAAERKKAVSYFLSNAGKEYGFKQLVGLALMRVFRLKKNPCSDGHASSVCVEEVVRFLKQALDVDTDLNPDSAGLQELDELLKKGIQ